MILVSTPGGRQALRVRDALLTPSMRMVFMLFDGQRHMAQVVAATAGLGATADDVHTLLDLGWLQPTPGGPAGGAEPTDLYTQQDRRHARYQEGYRWARRLTAGLGLKGLRLHWAVDAAADYEQLVQLLPRIREAVGASRVSVLELVLLDVQHAADATRQGVVPAAGPG